MLDATCSTMESIDIQFTYFAKISWSRHYSPENIKGFIDRHLGRRDGLSLKLAGMANMRSISLITSLGVFSTTRTSIAFLRRRSGGDGINAWLHVF